MGFPFFFFSWNMPTFIYWCCLCHRCLDASCLQAGHVSLTDLGCVSFAQIASWTRFDVNVWMFCRSTICGPKIGWIAIEFCSDISSRRWWWWWWWQWWFPESSFVVKTETYLQSRMTFVSRVHPLNHQDRTVVALQILATFPSPSSLLSVN